jgi:hypothetical protein
MGGRATASADAAFIYNVYDARKLLADVARMVEKQKQERLKAAANGQGAHKE